MQVDGANQAGSVLHVKGEADFHVCQWIIIDGVRPVQPTTKAIIHDLAMMFTFSKKLEGNLIEIVPAIEPFGPYQNVSNCPCNNAIIRPYNDPGWQADPPEAHRP